MIRLIISGMRSSLMISFKPIEFFNRVKLSSKRFAPRLRHVHWGLALFSKVKTTCALDENGLNEVFIFESLGTEQKMDEKRKRVRS